jgi:hypothetical protein
MTASGMFPPVAQALTFHWIECPRALLACAGATSTQRLTCAASGTVLAPLYELMSAGVAVVVAVGVGFAVWVCLCVGLCLGLCLGLADEVVFEVVGVALSETLGVVVGAADSDGLAFAVVRPGVGVADGVFVGDFTTAFGVVAFGVAAGLDVSL